MIVLKSGREIELMHRAGQMVARTMSVLKQSIKAGVTTAELDRIAERTIREAGGEPAFKGYRGFPASICVSLNDEVVHGIPSDRCLVDGDIVSIDIGVTAGGYNGDAAFTVAVGTVSDEARVLIETTLDCLNAGIARMVAGNRVGDVSAAIQQCAEAHGFSVVRDFVGHGIGRNMHEEPKVPNFGEPGTGVTLEPGMTLAIEPMVVTGQYRVTVDSDGWTVRTADGGLSAHWEHTVAVTDEGPLVLTGGEPT